MTEIDSFGKTWAETVARASSRYTIVLVVLGPAFESVRGDVLAVCNKVTTVEEYIAEEFVAPEAGVIALADMESFCEMRRDSQKFGALRERIHRDVDNGKRFILISKYPKMRFPEVPGSSVLLDAKIVFPPVMETVGKGGGISALAPILNNLGLSEAKDLFEGTLKSLGDEALAILDNALFESLVGRDEILSLLKPDVLEGLRCTGLIQFEGADYCWSEPRRFGELKDALADVLARLTAPPDLIAETFGHIWSLERSIRKVMRERAIAVWDKNWRVSCLNGNLPTEVVNRAVGDAYAAAKSLKEIRDPFEWLTLGELLEVRSRPEYGDLGLEKVLWRRMAEEVLPVRNRISHMRLLQPDDLSRVRKWETVFERKLKAS